MKKLLALLAALTLSAGLTACFAGGPEPVDEAHAIRVLPLIRQVEATDFPVDAEFPAGKATRFQLAQALRQAAQTELDASQGVSAGLGEGQRGFWSYAVHLEGTASGFAPGDLWLELTCGMTDNVVRVTAHRGREGGVCYLEGEDLYQLLRHRDDRDLTVEQEDYALFRKDVERAVDKIYWEERAKGQPYTGWEVTQFSHLASYEDKTDDTTIHVYAVDYAMLTDRPEAVNWSGQMRLDSLGRVENVGDFGRLATRYWWWGEKYETALLGRDRDEKTELAEAREALNASNVRD